MANFERVREGTGSAFTLFWYFVNYIYTVQRFPSWALRNKGRRYARELLSGPTGHNQSNRAIKIEERREILTRTGGVKTLTRNSLCVAGGDETLGIFIGAILQEHVVTPDGAIVCWWCPSLGTKFRIVKKNLIFYLFVVALELTTGSFDGSVQSETLK